MTTITAERIAEIVRNAKCKFRASTHFVWDPTEDRARLIRRLMDDVEGNFEDAALEAVNAALTEVGATIAEPVDEDERATFEAWKKMPLRFRHIIDDVSIEAARTYDSFQIMLALRRGRELERGK